MSESNSDQSKLTYEYRVRWQRQPRENVVWHNGPKTTSYSRLYQSEKAAREKVERLVQLDIDKANEEDYTVDDFGRPIFDFPDLLAPPTIERRVVGTWESE